jgi:ABC-2 type transport system permease protein
MNPTTNAARLGVRRGLTEFGKSLRAPEDLTYYLFGTGVLVAVLVLNRDNELEGTGLTLAMYMVPGVLAFTVFFAASYGLATVVVTEREDGTLLRSKAVPHGMVGYVVGQVTRSCAEVAFSLVLFAVPAVLVLGSQWTTGGAGVVRVLALLLLGLLASVPLGFVIGSVLKNPRSVGGWGFLVTGALVAASGLFVPLVVLPAWAQMVAQVFPLYWLGLGMRGAVLPDAAVAAEVGESWRTLETFGMLGLWAVVGLVLAPILLRRMARRESGSSVEARRESALQRV